jgi:hypothetical protein
MFSFQPIRQVFPTAVVVFAFEQYAQFAVLQSRVHVPWAERLSSRMGDTTIRYSVRDCVAPFPFVDTESAANRLELEDAGKVLYQFREDYMLDSDEGLTKAYNALQDPEARDERVLKLRHLHEEMDRAVLGAYGWPDIEVPPYCPTNDAEDRALQVFTDEVMDRLYVLNAERAAEEARHGPAKKSTKKRPSKKPLSGKGEHTMSLPGMTDSDGAD